MRFEESILVEAKRQKWKKTFYPPLKTVDLEGMGLAVEYAMKRLQGRAEEKVYLLC